MDTARYINLDSMNGPQSPVPYDSGNMVERLRALAESSMPELVTVIEYLPFGLYLGDFSGITLCNRMGLELLGFDTFAELQQNIAALAERIQTRSPVSGARLRPEEEPFLRALHGDPCTREVAYTHLKSGQEMIVECAAVPIRENGKLVAALAVSTDITTRRRGEAEAEAKRLFDEVTAAREQAFHEKVQALLQIGCRYLKFEQGIVARIEGEQYTIEQIEAPASSDIRPGAVFALKDTFCDRTVEAASSISFEHAGASEWAAHPAYRKSPCEAYLGAAIPLDGAPYGTLSFSSLTQRAHPISMGEREWVQLVARWIGHELEQQQAVEAREQQAKLFDTVLSSIVDYAYTFDRSGRFTYVNQALLDLWQRDLADVLGKTFFELDYPAELATRLHGQVETVFSTGQRLKDETSYTGPDGVAGYYEYIFVPVFGNDGRVEVVVGSTHDITARQREKREKEELLQTLEVERARLTDLIRQAPAFIAVLRGPDHVFERVNLPYLQLIGQRDLLGKPVREAFPDIEGQGFFEILDEVYRTGKPFIGKEMRILLQENAGAPLSEHYIDFVYQSLVEADGSVSGIFVHGVDLTERMHAEEALRESEARFRGLADNIAQLAWIAEGSGGIFWYNRRWFDYTGTTLEEMRRWGWKKVHHPEHLERVVERFARSVRAGEIWEDIFPLRGKDSQYRWFLSRAVPVRDEAGKVIRWFGTNTDVTEQRKDEEALRQRQDEIETLNHRLRRAMTETHHRVKNNLQLISALIEMRKQSGQETVPISEIVRLGQNIQAMSVIHDILTTDARLGGKAASISVKEVFEQFLPLLQSTLGDRRLLTRIDEVLLPGNQATSLALIVNELVSNAVKHGSGDVELTLSTEGRRATLEACDDGPGFPEGFDAETAAHTGLELIENIARYDLRAAISYEKRPQGGARVVLTFPVTTPQES